MSYGYYEKSRNVPLFLPIKLLFGRTISIVGMVFSGIALVFILSFGAFVEPNPFNESSPSGTGVITNIVRTNTSINDQAVLEFYYIFQTNTGVEKQGVSYSQDHYLNVGDTIKVIYEPDEPYRSVIVGMRRGVIEPWIILVFLPFLLIGLILLVIAIRKANKDVKLLKFGRKALGKLITKEATNITINNKPVYNFYFQFMAEGGKTYTAVCKTHLPYWIEDEVEEKLVYDPSDPENALLIDSLPKALRTYFKEID